MTDVVSTHYTITSSRFWLRLAYMLPFAVLLHIVFSVLWLVIVVQCVLVVISGQRQTPLTQFCAMGTAYLRQIMAFLTFASEDKPFPFADMPAADVRH